MPRFMPSVLAASLAVASVVTAQTMPTDKADPQMKAVLDAHKTMWDEKMMPASAKADNGATWLTDFQSGKVGMIALAASPSTSTRPTRSWTSV